MECGKTRFTQQCERRPVKCTENKALKLTEKSNKTALIRMNVAMRLSMANGKRKMMMQPSDVSSSGDGIWLRFDVSLRVTMN